MSLYEKYVLPPMLDLAMRQEWIMHQRGKVIPQAQGTVLEIGVGSGLNLAYYDKEKVTKLYGLDPSKELQVKARKRAQEAGIDVDFLLLGGESIPLDDESIDTVTMTYTLCTIPDGAAALSEMKRVLKPGGQLIFCEHGRAPDADVARWQDRLTPIWKKIAGGCRLNVKIDEVLGDAGFEVNVMENRYLPGPRFASYNYWGSATRS